MKKEHESPLGSCADLLQSLNSATRSLDWRRDQQSEQAGGSTTVRVLKNRYSGETGVACNLEYDLDTCKFIEHEPEKEFDPSTDF